MKPGHQTSAWGSGTSDASFFNLKCLWSMRYQCSSPRHTWGSTFLVRGWGSSLKGWWEGGGGWWKWGSKVRVWVAAVDTCLCEWERQKCTGVLWPVHTRHTAAYIYPSSLTSPPDFSSTQNWRDQVIKLVSGSLPTERSIYSLTQYVISWVISPPLYRVPVSVQSTSDCQPTERRVKLSSLRATLDWQTSAGLCSDSVITRGSVCCDQSAKHQHGMQIFSNTKVIICHWLKNTCFGGKPKKL